MKEEMMNLRQKQEGKNVKLIRVNSVLGKDKFSALEDGLWYTKTLEDKNYRRKVDVDSNDFLFIKQPEWGKKQKRFF